MECMVTGAAGFIGSHLCDRLLADGHRVTGRHLWRLGEIVQVGPFQIALAEITAKPPPEPVREPAPAARPPAPKGAVHSAEIEYALGNLSGNKVYEWGPDDSKVSAVMEEYFANFIKTGNPNGGKLAKWPAANKGTAVQFLHIDVETKAETEAHRGRYLLMDKLAGQAF